MGVAFFTRVEQTRLYVAQTDGSQRWLAYVLPADAKPDPGIELAAALGEQRGSFVFAARRPEQKPEALAEKLAALVAATPGARKFLWLTDPDRIEPATARWLAFDEYGTVVTMPLQFPCAGGLDLVVNSGARLGLSGTLLTLTLGGPSGALALVGPFAPRPPEMELVTQVEVPLSGGERGSLVFHLGLQRLALFEKLRWGFQAAGPAEPPRAHLGAWYPLAEGRRPGPADLFRFRACLDPSTAGTPPAEAGDSAYLAFSGTNPVLHSYYRTRSGHQVLLEPVDGSARLVFTASPPDGRGRNFLLCPAGDFVLKLVPGLPPGIYDLLCGLAGTETVAFQPGDRLRFQPGRAAFAQGFPFAEATSPLQPPRDPQAPLLSETFRTSYAAFVPAGPGANHYCAQPRGATLYGKDKLIHERSRNMLGLMEPGLALKADCFFPLVPYAGVEPDQDGTTAFTEWQVRDFEAKVQAPARRQAIAGAELALSSTKEESLLGAGAGAGRAVRASAYPAATPAGLVATVAGGRFRELLLAKSRPGVNDFRFTELAPALQQAFQTSELFLVIANANYLGRLVGAGQDPPPGPRFYNRLYLDKWVLEAAVGQGNQYADYRSVMIVKGRTGISLEELAARTDLWTQAAQLGAPGYLRTGGQLDEPRPDELPVLSQWLQDYIRQAREQEGAYFTHFNRLVQDKNWTGILVLKARIAGVPDELQGLLGVLDANRFYAHHVGVEISRLEGSEVALKEPSSLFGLIYYVDPGSDPQGEGVVAPLPGADYDFRVLTLKALFANTAVQRFESRAQLTLNKLFGLPVTGLANSRRRYNAIVLQGSYQNQNGRPFYMLDTAGDHAFTLASPVLDRVHVVKAQFTTLGAAPGAEPDERGEQETVSRFNLWGYMNFRVLEAEVEEPETGQRRKIRRDLFSFGSDANDHRPPGLRFANLGIEMAAGTRAGERLRFTFDPAKMTFDVAQSTVRRGSLYERFPLELEGLVAAEGEKTPAEQGYLVVGTDLPLAGPEQGWQGLRFRLHMGTPGALAAKVGLIAHLLLAWGPGGEGEGLPVQVGLQLPGAGGGAKLLSLQGVLRLSIGDIQLTYDEANKGYLLTLSDMALKLLGLLKLPPGGATSFYLFGNPQPESKAGELGWYAVYNKES